MVDPDYRNKGFRRHVPLCLPGGPEKGYTYGDGSTIHEFNIRMRGRPNGPAANSTDFPYLPD